MRLCASRSRAVRYRLSPKAYDAVLVGGIAGVARGLVSKHIEYEINDLDAFYARTARNYTC